MKPKPNPAPVAAESPEIQPCHSCAWFVRGGNYTARCHANPPQIRLPFENAAAWPVVPLVGGGCRLHESAKKGDAK